MRLTCKLAWKCKICLFVPEDHRESCDPTDVGSRSDANFHHQQTMMAGDSSLGIVMYFIWFVLFWFVQLRTIQSCFGLFVANVDIYFKSLNYFYVDFLIYKYLDLRLICAHYYDFRSSFFFLILPLPFSFLSFFFLEIVWFSLRNWNS